MDIFDLNRGGFEDDLDQYVKTHNAQTFRTTDLFNKAKSRIKTKKYSVDNILLLGHCINWIFKKHRVSDELVDKFKKGLKTIAENVVFITPAGGFTTKDVKLLIITPDKKTAHIITNENKILPLHHYDSPTKKLEIIRIEELEIETADIINTKLIEHKKSLKAIPKMKRVFEQLMPETEITTNASAILVTELNKLTKDDIIYKDLIEMASDILDDLELIFQDVKLYWGKSYYKK